jgi:hypothetical protein
LCVVVGDKNGIKHGLWCGTKIWREKITKKGELSYGKKSIDYWNHRTRWFISCRISSFEGI